MPAKASFQDFVDIVNDGYTQLQKFIDDNKLGVSFSDISYQKYEEQNRTFLYPYSVGPTVLWKVNKIMS